MPEIAQSLVEELAEAAAALRSPRAVELVQAIREHSSAARLQILVVGSTGSGRASVVDVVLQRPGLLPQSPLPKAPLGIAVRYGPAAVVETIAADGARAALPPGRLRSFLTGAAEQYVAVEMQAPCEALKLCDLRIEPLEAHRSPSQWHDLLAATDFAILVLNATALLSEQERRFVRDQLADGYGLARVGIIVNRMDLVPEEERASLLELVRIFLGPFESQPAILELSATQALQELASGEEGTHEGCPYSGYDALKTLLSDLVERHAALREAALHAALEAALAELAEGAAREQALLSLDQTEVAELRARIASRRDWLQARVERTQRRVDTFVGTLIREQLLQESQSFGDVFRRRLPDEIMEVEDIGAIKRHLPGYIETVWGEFLNGQMIAVQSKLTDETMTIDRMIETDLEELLGPWAGLEHLFQEVGPAADGIRSFVMPKRGRHRASGAAKGLSLYGYIMLFFNPPLGVLSLAASHLVRRFYQGDIERADKQAIIASATSACRDFERDLRVRIDEQFAQLAAQLKTEVSALYADGVGRIEAALAESAARGQEVDARRAEIATLTGETIPRLRLLFEQLGRREVA